MLLISVINLVKRFSRITISYLCSFVLHLQFPETGQWHREKLTNHYYICNCWMSAPVVLLNEACSIFTANNRLTEGWLIVYLTFYGQAVHYLSYFYAEKRLNDFFVVDFFVLNATFSNISAISWRPVLVVEGAGVPREKHLPWASNWSTLSLTAVSQVHAFL